MIRPCGPHPPGASLTLGVLIASRRSVEPALPAPGVRTPALSDTKTAPMGPLSYLAEREGLIRPCGPHPPGASLTLGVLIASRRSVEPALPAPGVRTPALSDTKTAPMGPLSYLAEREGFEPPEPFGSPHFECGAFDHSATSPEHAECTSSLAPGENADPVAERDHLSRTR